MLSNWVSGLPWSDAGTINYECRQIPQIIACGSLLTSSDVSSESPPQQTASVMTAGTIYLHYIWAAGAMAWHNHVHYVSINIDICKTSRVKAYVRRYIHLETSSWTQIHWACAHGGSVLRLIKLKKKKKKSSIDLKWNTPRTHVCFVMHGTIRASDVVVDNDDALTFTLLSQSLPEPSLQRFPSEDSVMQQRRWTLLFILLMPHTVAGSRALSRPHPDANGSRVPAVTIAYSFSHSGPCWTMLLSQSYIPVLSTLCTLSTLDHFYLCFSPIPPLEAILHIS